MKSKLPIAGSHTNYNGYVAARMPVVYGIGKVFALLLCQLATVAAAPLSTLSHAHLPKLFKPVDEPADVDDPDLWLNLGLAGILVLLGGAFAGLTIALMGQDGVYLQVIATSGEGKEQRHAEKVHNLLKKGKHWVLVTLLLSNVIVNETLPIVLDRSLGGGWPAVLGSTVLIVIFGEVIPQSVCVRYGLSIGAFMAPSVLGLMWILAPVAWPTAKLLDRLLGEDHGTVYKKAGLKTLVTLHKTLGTSPTDRLNQDEVTIISAVLDLKEKAVGDIMTPMDDVFTMSADTVLDENTMNVILTAGYSRIPIYEPSNPQNFVGMLLVKILITYDPEDCKKVNEFALATLPETRPETSCLDIVNFFQEGKSHMVLVSDFPGENYGAIGVVTLEDVIEELIGEEIIDESDVYIDVHKAIRRMAPAPKARVQKGHIVGHPENAPLHESEDLLVDLSEGRSETRNQLVNGDSRSRSESPAAAAFGTSPKTTFIRRSSGGVDGNRISVRGNVNDMREHLKHLGPSNLASRPKSTRYNTVKIKPGHGAIRTNSRTDSNLRHDSIDAIIETVTDPHVDIPASPASRGGEGEGLLKSAGREASDGVQALQQGYGTLDRTFSQTSNKPFQGNRPKNDASTSPQEVLKSSVTKSTSPPRFSRPHVSTANSDRSSDTLGSLSSKDNSPSRWKRGTARSGSITENIIEAGGVRKVVLETNGSSSDDRDDRVASKIPQGAENNSPIGVTDRSLMYDEHTERPATPKGEEVKKKRRRTRKRKGVKSSEATLLGESSNQ